MSRPTHIEPWGKLRGSIHEASELRWSDQGFPKLPDKKTTLPFGMGRSYGDSCLNPDRNICLTRSLNKFLHFDTETGVLECEAGVTLDELLQITVPQGWFPAVVPGTKFVTIGGAIANDIHGKNHHTAGTWGNHVIEVSILRSHRPREITNCSRTENEEMFRATIGGLGLTGIIVSAKIQLQRITSSFLHVETQPFHSLEDFYTLSKYPHNEYSVAWVDLMAKNPTGIFIAGNHNTLISDKPVHQNKQTNVPVNAPNWLVNKFSVKAFNQAYRRQHAGERGDKIQNFSSHYDPFFFPLDKVGNWNRLYGKAGFFQYQSVVPKETELEAVKVMLKAVAESKQGSSLAVLKRFGNKPSEGMLSFPMEGTTLAMDFPNRGWDTLELMHKLDDIVREAGGRMYAAKDTRITATDFQRQYPDWRTLERLRDRKLMSSFWKRVTQTSSI